MGNNSGNFSISTLLIGTAFSRSDEERSKTFEDFQSNRITIANRLASERGIPQGTEDNFPQGFSSTQQDVLLPAFFAAISGQNADRVNLDAFRQIPIPNWTIKYTGLLKLKEFKKKFNRFSVSHGYRSTWNSIKKFRLFCKFARTQSD